MLFGTGEARSTEDIEERMSAPDLELLEFAWPYLVESREDRMAVALNRGLGGK